MPTDTEDSGSPTISRSKRVSIGSNIASNIASRDYSGPAQEIISEPHHSPEDQNSLDTPLTPEQSPPSRYTQKRSADQIDEEEQSTPSHSRESSESFQPCLCRADPKVPRPRNGKYITFFQDLYHVLHVHRPDLTFTAFILYRQHHNTEIVKQNPGVNNPDISKIIGHLWKNESEEEKNRWKAFAEVRIFFLIWWRPMLTII